MHSGRKVGNDAGEGRCVEEVQGRLLRTKMRVTGGEWGRTGEEWGRTCLGGSGGRGVALGDLARCARVDRLGTPSTPALITVSGGQFVRSAFTGDCWGEGREERKGGREREKGAARGRWRGDHNNREKGWNGNRHIQGKATTTRGIMEQQCQQTFRGSEMLN